MSTRRTPGTSRVRRVVTQAAFVAALIGLAAGSAEAQAYGQWTWRAALRASRQSYDNRVGDATASSQEQDELALGVSVDGFVVHPAFLAFTVGADVSLASLRVPDQAGRQSRLWGFGATAALLPRGRYPLTVYARRQLHDDFEPAAGDYLSFGVPSGSTSYGGRLRLRDGPLHGALFGLDRSRTSYRDPAQESTLYEKAFAAWNGSSERHQRRARIERRVESFGTPLYETRNLTTNYEQSSRLGEEWRLRSTNVGLRRSLLGPTSSPASSTLRSNNTASRGLGRTGQLRLDYTGGVTWGQGSAFQSHDASADYSWKPGGSWSTSVQAGYGVQRGGDGHSDAPRVSGTAHWSGGLGGVLVGSSAGLGLQWLRFFPNAGPPASTTGLVTSLRASAQHGSPAGLRKGLEVSWDRNRLRAAGETIEALPDLGTSLAGLGTENDLRARLTLAKRWRGYSADGYSEYARRRSHRTLETQRFSTRAWTHVVQISARRVSLTLNSTDTAASALTEQHAASRSAAISFRPARWVSLAGLGGRTSRSGPIGPEAEGQRYEIRGDVRVGATTLEARYYRMVEEGPSIQRRENQGFYVSIKRSFAGWLPIVTETSNGGVIR